ncbi:MAG: head-tail connector protein, partial [Clostridia bacterium]
MPLLTLEQCRTHCRIDGDYDDAILGDLLAAATDAASAYLRRALFADQAALDLALDQLPQDMAAAVTGHDAAVAAANAETNTAKAKAMRDVADRRLAVAS